MPALSAWRLKKVRPQNPLDPLQSMKPDINSRPRRAVATLGIAVVAALLLVPACIVWLTLLLKEGVQWISQNHEKANDKVRDVARSTLIASKVAVLWAWLVAPTGLTAAAAAIGITSTPAIVVLAPFFLALTGAAFAVSAAMELFSKRQKRREKNRG